MRDRTIPDRRKLPLLQDIDVISLIWFCIRPLAILATTILFIISAMDYLYDLKPYRLGCFGSYNWMEDYILHPVMRNASEIALFSGVGLLVLILLPSDVKYHDHGYN